MTTLIRPPCNNPLCDNIRLPNQAYCIGCLTVAGSDIPAVSNTSSLAEKYPKYYKSVLGLDAVDVYCVHKLFNIQDSSGALQHASKKLLLSGVRTGGKSKYDDIKEARDTLDRWLELHRETL